MNKIKKIILVVFLLILVYIGYRILLSEHEVSYTIDNYNISEHFYINKNHFYDLVITNNKENYTYTLEKNFSKGKRIIKSIKEFRGNNLVCIVPIYKNDIELNVYCDLDNKEVSIDYLIKTDNNDFKTIKKKLKKYKINYPSSSNAYTEYKKNTIYQKNLLDNYNYYIWNYKGILVLNNKTLKYQKILNYDLYDNIMATTVDKYYVLFENTDVNGIENVYYYDSRKSKLNKFKLKEKLAKDSYINGVVDNIIYVTDRKNQKEYKINISKKSIERIDNDVNYIVYENNKKKEVSKSDFFMGEQYFDTPSIDDKIIRSIELIKSNDYNNTNNKSGETKISSFNISNSNIYRNAVIGNISNNNRDIIKSNKYYYYYDDNKIYKVLETNTKYSKLLLELEDIKEWKVYDNVIVIMAKDAIYTYTEKEGLRKIVQSNELKYNYKNIYKIGKK